MRYAPVAGVIGIAGLALLGGADFPTQVAHEMGPVSTRLIGVDLTPVVKFTAAYAIAYHWLGCVRHMASQILERCASPDSRGRAHICPTALV